MGVHGKRCGGVSRLEASAWAVVAALCGCMAGVKAQAATTHVFRDGLNGYSGTRDATIRTSAPGVADGAAEFVEWNTDDPAGSQMDAFALLRFDDIFGVGAGQIPPGSPIISATLTYTIFDGSSVGTVSEALVAWTEATTYSGFGPAAGVQAGDYGFENIATAHAPAGAVPVNVTRSLTTWSEDPSQNRGWIFRPTNSVTRGRFRSSEFAASPSQRPTLTVVVNDSATPTLLRGPYLQSGAPTSMTIVWRTDMATESVVRYGAAPGTLDQTVTVAGARRDHAVEVAGLAPDTVFFYSVGTPTATLAGGDAAHFFRTSPEVGAHRPFTFWVLGDAGTLNGPMLAMRDAMLAVNGGAAPDLLVHVGDIAYVLSTDGEMTDTFLGPHGSILRRCIAWPTVGNHEEFNADSNAEMGVFYDTFVLPRMGECGGAASNTEAYYSFDYGDVHFVCMNTARPTRTPGSPMLQWLEADLAAAAGTAKWLVAYWHHPVYSHGTHDSDLEINSIEMRQHVMPLLEQGGVDLVLVGHSHGYERSFLVDGAYDTPTTAAGHIVDGGGGAAGTGGAYVKSVGLNPREGAVHVVAGHGAAAHGVGSHPLIYLAENFVGSCLVEVNGDTLSFRNIRSTGVVSDMFTIVKQGAAPCPADLNGDGFVNAADLAAVLGNWGLSGVAADLNEDGTVNSSDLAVLLGGWGDCR